MAYISPEGTKSIRRELKKQLPAFRFSVQNKDYMKAFISILSGPENFNLENGTIELHTPVQSDNKAIQKIIEIAQNAPALADGGMPWYDDSDIQSDYFDIAYYYTIRVGDSNSEKPYIKK